MKVVGIKSLKNKLSSYLRLVRSGEVVLISDRDEIVAEIRRPTRMYSAGISRFAAFIESAAQCGAVQKASSSRLFLRTRDDLLPNPVGTQAMDLLDLTRADR